MTDKLVFGYILWHTLWHSRQLHGFCVTIIQVCDNSAWCVTFDRCITGSMRSPPIARCGQAGLSHWRFRVQIITLFTKIKITLRLAYNTSDTALKVICTLLPAVQARASIHCLLQAESSNTENFEGGLEHSLHSFSPPHTGNLPDCLHLIHRSPDKCAKPHEAIKLQFLTIMETQDSPVTYVI